MLCKIAISVDYMTHIQFIDQISPPNDLFFEVFAKELT